MKNSKYILHSVAVLAVAALATACSSEDELTDKTSGTKETVTITAYQPNTRVGFDKDGNGYWQAGDEICVWSTGENKFSYFAIASGAGEASATFSGTVTDGIGQYAVYPYDQNHKLSGSSLTYYLPSEYTYTSVDQTFLPTEKNGNSFCMPMYGTVANNEVSFKHLGGVICLKIDKMPAESGTVKVIEATKKLCGTFTATLTDDAPEIETGQTKLSSSKSVTFVYSGATADATGVFYLPVATGSYNLTIEVYDGKEKYSKTTATVEMERKSLQVVNVVTDYTDKSKTIDGHKFIDLALPSGLLWAETNIGAETAYDGGNHYAWGETSTKDDYSEATYTLGSYSKQTLTYNEYTSTDGKTVLDKNDDAAYINWGTHCRMPTQSEFKELINSNNCTWEWVEETNSAGKTIYYYKVVSNKNGNIICLPVSGYFTGSELYLWGCGFYWSSTLNNSNVGYAYDLDFTIKGIYYNNSGSCSRWQGLAVRPVAEPLSEGSATINDAVWNK